MRTRSRRGHAVVEMALMAPWILFLFAGVFDMGMYSQALIATTNAARAAALYTSSSPSTAADSAGACVYAIGELKAMPNVNGLAACGAAPLQVTAAVVAGPDGLPASEVTVAYQTPWLIPLPGLAGQFTITRRAQMKF